MALYQSGRGFARKPYLCVAHCLTPATKGNKLDTGENRPFTRVKESGMGINKSPGAWIALGTSLMLAGPCFGAELRDRPATFAKDVAPILQAKCQDCHWKGSMAPMSLESYQETRPWAKSIKERVVTRGMPPWHLDKTVGIQHYQN